MSYLDRDGVIIYYEQHGAGPSVLLVVRAIHASMPPGMSAIVPSR